MVTTSPPPVEVVSDLRPTTDDRPPSPPAPAAPPPRHHGPPRPVIAVLALAVLAGVGWWVWRHLPSGADDGLVRASGTLEAEDVAIAAETQARVTAVLVEAGDAVRRGQLLVQLDDSLIALEQRQAQGPELQRVELQLEKLRLRAPIDGRIGERAIRVGEIAAPGATLLTLTPLAELQVTLYVLARDLGRIQVGQAVRLTADPFPGEMFPGWVTSISNRAEFTPRNVQTAKDRLNLVFGVKVRAPNPGERLKPGLPVDAVFVE